MTRLTVPFIDANIVDVTVVAWHKSEGEPVTTGEVLAEISTDKAAYEIESPADGIILKILAQAKSIVPVKYILAVIGDHGETDATAAADNAKLMAAYSSAIAPEGVGHASSETRTAEEPLRATPKARRLAQTNGIELAKIARATGTGMITEAVVLQYLQRSE